MASKYRLVAAGIALICVAAVWHYVRDSDTDTQPGATQRDVDLVFPIHASTPRSALAPGSGQTSPATARLANPLERARDLRSVYERYKSSEDPNERNAAYRAWNACFPAFVAAQGQPVTLDAVTRTLPQNAPNIDERIEAYRNLLGRCKEFFSLPRDAIMAETQKQRNAWLNGKARAEGERVLQRFEQGDTEGALRDARAIIASRDAYAIYSLRDFMSRYLSAQRSAASDGTIGQADLRALAFYLVPCELGMECGPDSLTALQLCANGGECAGTVADRYAHSFAGQVDPETLLRESRRIADAIRAGNYAALGL